MNFIENFYSFSKDCGLSSQQINLQSNVIGGVDAVPNSWPSIAALFFQINSTTWVQRCAGVLIDNKTVMTAAQ